MAKAGKVYVVEDADPEDSSGIPAGTFPGTLAGLLDALDAARYRSAAGTPKALVIAAGKDRQVIRRFENGNETWSASRIEIRTGPGDGPRVRRELSEALLENESENLRKQLASYNQGLISHAALCERLMAQVRKLGVAVLFDELRDVVAAKPPARLALDRQGNGAKVRERVGMVAHF